MIILLLACSTTEPCEEFDCFTPPPAVILEFVDPVTGENLYSNGTLVSANIKLTDQNNAKVDFQFISENGVNLLYLELGWVSGINTYVLELGLGMEIEITIKFEERMESCCTFFIIEDFSISNYRYTRSATTGNFIIFAD